MKTKTLNKLLMAVAGLGITLGTAAPAHAIKAPLYFSADDITEMLADSKVLASVQTGSSINYVSRVANAPTTQYWLRAGDCASLVNVAYEVPHAPDGTPVVGGVIRHFSVLRIVCGLVAQDEKRGTIDFRK